MTLIMSSPRPLRVNQTAAQLLSRGESFVLGLSRLDLLRRGAGGIIQGGLGPGAGFPFMLLPESRRASSAPPWCSSPAPPCRRPLGSPHATSDSPRCFPLPRLIAAARQRMSVAIFSPLKLPKRPQAAAWRQAILAAHAPHGGRRRPNGGRTLPRERFRPARDLLSRYYCPIKSRIKALRTNKRTPR